MQQIGRYQILDEIARGGMGIVYRALDPISKRKVAIKVLISPDPDPRFRQEIRSLARLQHPGIVAFYDVDQDLAGRDFVVMELVDGESLWDRVKRDGPLPMDEALGLIQQLARAIDYAHQRGVLHRDLKPHNVLVTHDGRVKLTDFGLGKVVNQTQELSKPSLTNAGEIMGTPAYMPPEQAAGEKGRMGPASDVYSLGATLYALLTGKPPFEAETMLNVIYAVLDKQPAPPSQHRPGVPAEVDALVLRCLAKDPEDRYASAGELIAALEGNAELEEPPELVMRRHDGLLLIAAGITILGLSVALVIATQARRQPEPGKTPAPAAIASTSPGHPPAVDHDALVLSALEQGQRDARLGDWEGAAAHFTEAIRLDPDCIDAYGGRGAARTNLRDWRGAIDDCSRAIQSPDAAQAARSYNNRGVARRNLGDHRGAIEDCTEAIRLQPDFAAAYCNRAGSRSVLGDHRGAIEDCTEAIRLQPDFAAAYDLRGACRALLRDDQGALVDFDQAVSLDADFVGAYVNRGITRINLRDYQSALKDFNHAIRLEPDHAPAHHYRGLTRVYLHDHQGAIADLERALALKPGKALAGSAREYLQVARQKLAEEPGGD